MQLKPLNSASKVIPQSQEKEQKPSKRSATAILTGAALGLAPSVYVATDAIVPKGCNYMRMMGNIVQRGMPDVDTFKNIKQIAEKAIQDTGLASKGVKLQIVTPKNVKSVAQELINSNSKAPFGKNIAKNFAKMIKYGANAAFSGSTNKVYIGSKGLYSSVFHEIGHAMNYNSSKIMKFMQKARCLTPYGVPILGLGLFAASLFHNVKPETLNKPKSLWEKTKDFVKNNVGKISFATFLPMLIEEGAASVKGLKLAKQYLKPEQVSRLAKNYLSGFKSYAMVATVLSAAIGFGNMIAQGIQEKKNQNKQNIKTL